MFAPRIKRQFIRLEIMRIPRGEMTGLDINRVDHFFGGIKQRLLILGGKGQGIAKRVRAAETDIEIGGRYAGIGVAQINHGENHAVPIKIAIDHTSIHPAGDGVLRVINRGMGRRRKGRAHVTEHALAGKHVQTVFLFRGIADGIALRVAFGVKRRFIGNQRRLIELYGQTKKEREIGFHLGIWRSLDQGFAEIALPGPESFIKGGLDKLTIGGGQPLARLIPETAQGTVFGMDLLCRQRSALQELATEILEGPLATGHFPIIQRRRHRLRSQRGVLEKDFAMHGPAVPDFPDPGIGVTGTEGGFSVEQIIGPSIPEVPMVVGRVENRRGIAGGDAPRIQYPGMKNGILSGITGLRLGVFSIDGFEIGEKSPRGRNHIVRTEEHG